VVYEPAVQDVATRFGVPSAQIGLAWQLAHSLNIMIISGTSSIDHLRENTEAGSVQLGCDVIVALKTMTSSV